MKIKKAMSCLLAAALLAACQPTPAEDIIVNRGDGALEAEYGALAGELETLRREGREKSYRFREKAGRKLLDGQILALLRASSLADRLPEDGGGKP